MTECFGILIDTNDPIEVVAKHTGDAVLYKRVPTRYEISHGFEIINVAYGKYKEKKE